VHQNEKVEDDLDFDGDDGLKILGDSTARMLTVAMSMLLRLLKIPKGIYSMRNITMCL
jgi:hypothetical protein